MPRGGDIEYDDRTERVDVDWLIGADGAGSVAGRAIDISFDDDTDAQQFQLADAPTDADLPDDQGHNFLHPQRPFVL